MKELAELKAKLGGALKYDKGNAIITIISGAGGDDAEDFSRMLLDMYMKYANKKNWGVFFIHENKNDNGGYRNVSFEITNPSTDSTSSPQASSGRSGPYGTLRNESGVHRLVRISPFNAKKLRHTSFSLVEILTKIFKTGRKRYYHSGTRFKNRIFSLWWSGWTKCKQKRNSCQTYSHSNQYFCSFF